MTSLDHAPPDGVPILRFKGGYVCLSVKDVDFGYGQITVRDGKGEKDRRTILPGPLADPLKA